MLLDDKSEVENSPRVISPIVAAKLPHPTEIRRFASEIPHLAILHIMITLFLMAASAGVIFTIPHPVLRVAASSFLALLFVRMFSIYHDHMHGCYFRDSKAAGVLFRLYGMFVLAPSAIWDESHSFHHRHNTRVNCAQIGSFPIMTLQQWRVAPWHIRMQYRIARSPAFIAMGSVTVFLLGMCVLPAMRDPRRYWEGLGALGMHAALFVLSISSAGLNIWFYLIGFPHLIAGALGAYMFYAQHNFVGSQIFEKAEWTARGAALHSSSYMRMNFFMAWATANLGYHHIHHLNPLIPFYRLPEAMKALPDLQFPMATSLSPRDITACLDLAVWDSERSRFLTWKECRAI